MRRRPTGQLRLANLLLAAALTAGLVLATPVAVQATAQPAPVAPLAAPTVAASMATPTAAVAASTALPAWARWTGVSAVLGDGRLRITGTFADRSGGVLSAAPTGGFTGVTRMAGSFTGTAIVYSSGRYDVVAIGTDHRLRHRAHVGGRWSAWTVMGNGRYLGRPAAIRSTSGVLWVAAIGTNHQVYLVTRSGSSVSAPKHIGGTHVTGSPAISYRSSGYEVDVFWTTEGGVVQRRAMRAHRWGSISEVTRGFASGIGAIRTQDGGHRLVVVGRDRHVYLIASMRTGWGKPAQIGGSVVGSPVITYDGSRKRMDVMGVGVNGVLQYRSNIKGSWRGWTAVRTTVPPVAPPPNPAQVLVSRWGSSLTGLPGALSDLRTAAAGGTILSPCGTRVKLDPRLLNLLVAVTDRYDVMVNNMVTGHDCDAAQHPKGRAVDFNMVRDRKSGAQSNFHSGGSGDNDALDRQFVSFLGSLLPPGGGLGQRYCGSRGSAPLPATVRFFADTCNHQHAQVASS